MALHFAMFRHGHMTCNAFSQLCCRRFDSASSNWLKTIRNLHPHGKRRLAHEAMYRSPIARQVD